MKKLLSIFAATGLVASTTTTVVACSNEKISKFTLVEGATKEKIIEASGVVVKDGKLDKDYKETNLNEVFGGESELKYKGKIYGLVLDINTKDLASLFVESKKMMDDNEEGREGLPEFHGFSAKGNKGDKSFTLYLFKMDTTDLKEVEGKNDVYEGTVKFSNLFSYKVTL
ncbi:hypothetical protein SCHIN_v1c04810 [Spiroplasma chinense]|uniref:Lipoprotein n=1 Tax=Spiroplasma chinense TaxID=216932 RepID=A0A5B9Y3G1_9MOLU|nr:lipoprotein [Spiroplasma chinense]QEH61678.1 hypothetical protein SCHIN_v1c04810 [Spiroplasma chinense]